MCTNDSEICRLRCGRLSCFHHGNQNPSDVNPCFPYLLGRLGYLCCSLLRSLAPTCRPWFLVFWLLFWFFFFSPKWFHSHIVTWIKWSGFFLKFLTSRAFCWETTLKSFWKLLRIKKNYKKLGWKCQLGKARECLNITWFSCKCGSMNNRIFVKGVKSSEISGLKNVITV